MKKLYRVLVLLGVILMIGGCTARSEPHQEEIMDAASSQNSSQSSQMETEQPLPESEPASSSEQTVDENAVLLAGKYVFHTEGVEDIYCPNLVLREDGTCRLNVNLLTNMGAINGTYTLEQGILLTIEVDNLSFEGFVGDDTKKVFFEVASEESLMYRGTDAGEDAVIGMTNPLDLFEKES